MDAVQETDIDTLSNLEERITRAVQAITTLRGENHQLQERLQAVESELASTQAARQQAESQGAELRNENGHLQERLHQVSDELNALRGERKQVKDRIEKLLGQLDLLSA